MENRLGIFAIYDQDGIADDYVFFMIDDLKKNLTHLVVVCNGTMTDESVRNLKNHADAVLIRENLGYDWGAYKHALSDFIGMENIKKYDELVLMNDSCYGPLHSLSDVFANMEIKDLDFWGITEHMPIPHQNIPYHIQSYFIVVRKRLLQSSDFTEFWSDWSNPGEWLEVVYKHGLRFTKHFNDMGYNSGVYVDSSILGNTAEGNSSIWDSYRLISILCCPLVKRKVFTTNLNESLRYASGETARKTLDYIDRHLAYDVNMIWKNLIRISDVTELFNSLHLNYVFPSDISYNAQILNDKKIAVIAHLYYAFQLEENLAYIDEIPECVDVIITTPVENIKIKANNYFQNKGRANYKIILVDNRGRDVAALLVGCREYLMKYTYLCFTHDKGNTHSQIDEIDFTLGRSYKDLLWENSIKSAQYIENVISCFENNPKLGLLTVPSLRGTHRAWKTNFNVWDDVIKRMKIKCNYSTHSFPASLGSAFWCRPVALKALFCFGFEHSDFPSEPLPICGTLGHAIERLLPFVAQHEGYYFGTMMTLEYSSLYSVMYQYVSQETFSIHHKNIEYYNFTEVLVNNMRHIEDFLIRYKKIYVYGGGKYSREFIIQFSNCIEVFLGIVVSDGHRDSTAINLKPDYPLFELSDISPKDDEGIIIALKKKTADVVLKELSKRGYRNIVLYDI